MLKPFLWPLLLACLLSPVVQAAEDALRVGVVDLRKVATESRAGKAHKVEMERLIKEKQAQIERDRKKLEDMQAAAEKEALTFTDAQKRSKQREMEDKVAALKRLSDDAKQELAARDSEFTRKVLTELRSVVSDVARDEKVRLVLEKFESSVWYHDPALDITDKVLARFDARPAKPAK